MIVERSTMLPTAANYYGMALSVILPVGSSNAIRSNGPKFIPLANNEGLHKRFALLGFMEFSGSCFTVLGIIYAGSGVCYQFDDVVNQHQLFQVLYSSVVIFTALLSRIFLHKIINRYQWLSILGVTFGLMISALGTESNHDISSSQSIGLFFSMAATLNYALYYILSERILTSKTHPVTMEQQQTMVGIYVASIFTAYLVFYTIPNFQSLVTANVEAKNGSWGVIIFVYFVLVISGFLHSVTFFRLIGSVGSVATGILQSLRAVSVFGISAVLFCSEHENQCFNVYKGFSALVVVGGIMCFSIFSPSPKKTTDIPLNSFEE